jgi:hypothetical protein
MFNALKYIKVLEGVGFPREQAEAQVQLVFDTFQENIATKSDLGDLRSELKGEFSGLRSEFSELKSEFSELKSEFAELKSVVAEMKTDLIFKLGGLIVFCTGILGLLIKS